MAPTTSPELQWATAAVRDAMRVPAAVQGRLADGTLTKEDASPVTVADFGVQAVVARSLRQKFPEAVLVGEEDAAALKTIEGARVLEQVTGYVQKIIPGATSAEVCDWIDVGGGAAKGTYWTLDPIDGTKGFLRGDQYAIALALIVDGQVEIGVLGCPNLDADGKPDKGGPGAVFFASRGGGAHAVSAEIDLMNVFASPPVVGSGVRKLKVAPTSASTDARLLASFEAGHTDDANLENLRTSLASFAPYVRMDSQAKYAVLASGGAELLYRLLSPKRMDYKEKIWDQAAGMLVVQEAGGQVTDLDGKPLDFAHGSSLLQNRGVVASNGVLHSDALAAVRAIGA